MDPFARKMWRAGIGFAISLLLLVGGLKLFSMHEWPTCPDSVISEAASPGNRFVATLLQRRCGTDAPFFTRVNLRPEGPLTRGFLSGQVVQGTVFVVEQDAAGAGISVSWSDQDALTVRCPRCVPALVHQHDQQWGPVTIHYQVP
ncbi:MAG TPA: hypothetical protein VJV96_17090 [Candidatus Angelobacter sp.]|nr:hypothetical protein [Candidatus Angelobacter sp.]